MLLFPFSIMVLRRVIVLVSSGLQLVTNAKAGRAVIFGLIAGLGIGAAVGLGLGVYFLPILTAGLGLD